MGARELSRRQNSYYLIQLLPRGCEMSLPRGVCPFLALVSLLLAFAFLPSAAAQTCGAHGIAVQVLGSGGPELQDKRAMSSYLVWENGQARVLVDAGGGSALRFGESGATMSQLDVILFSHFHVDHSADFPALIKSSWFEDRKRPLPIYGPPGNDFMPSTTEFVSDFFSDKGVYRYLSELFAPGEQGSYKMQPHDVVADGTPVMAFHSGDTNGDGEGLVRVAKDADLFVAHNAVPEGVTGVERRLHMPPSVIGQVAQQAHVKKLVLSHRMLRTLGKETETLSEIAKSFPGPVTFANDLDCFPVE